MGHLCAHAAIGCWITDFGVRELAPAFSSRSLLHAHYPAPNLQRRGTEIRGEENHRTKQTPHGFKQVYSGLCLTDQSICFVLTLLCHLRNLWIENVPRSDH